MPALNRIMSLVKLRCPRCREGKMFLQKGFFPLKSFMDMPEKCAICNQKMELETGFYFGTGYISYALSVAILIAFFVAFHVLIGISFRDNSILTCLFSSIGFLVLCQPILMRISRRIYLGIFVAHEPNWNKKL
jgi:uncharacterized protein (DUF983 family)